MTKKIVGATYTVLRETPEFLINDKVVLCHDDGTDMPIFASIADYAPNKELLEMDWEYIEMSSVSLDEDPQVYLNKPFEINANGIKVTIPRSSKSITINSKTNAIEISWEEF